MIYLATILGILLFFSVYKNVKLGLTIIRLEDSIEECLDVIDEKYNTMSEVLKRPLFYDSPEVKSVVKDISEVRDSLHAVALALTKNIENIEQETE
jgi:hypothetical protein|tara:strand:- start:313 stop:600 length:288 start_codon:yes stop_codon:yes gene_type:complete